MWTANELVNGLAVAWQGMQAALTRFTPDDLPQMVTAERLGRISSDFELLVLRNRLWASTPPARLPGARRDRGADSS